MRLNGTKRKTSTGSNIFIYSEMVNKEVIALVLKDAFLLKNTKLHNVLNDNRNLDILNDCRQQVESFMQFFVEEGYKNRSIRFYMSYRELENVWVSYMHYISDSEYTKEKRLLVKSYAEKVRELNIIDNAKVIVVSYIIEYLHNCKIKPYCDSSSVSESYYIKPDLILKTIRISGHESSSYSGWYSVICCTKKPETEVVSTDKCKTFYVTIETYKEVLDELLKELVESRSRRISSEKDYYLQVANAENNNTQYSLER